MNQGPNTDDAEQGAGGVDPMEKLEREHAECLLFADQITEIAERGSDEAVADSIDEVAR